MVVIHPCIVVENVKIKRNIFELIGGIVISRKQILKRKKFYIISIMIKNKSIRLKPYIDYSCQLIKFKTISSVFNDSEKIGTLISHSRHKFSDTY